MPVIPPTTFDFWSLMFSGFAFIGVFYSVKLLSLKQKTKRNIILGLYLLLQSTALLEYVLYWTGLIFNAPHFAEITLLFPLSYGPLLVMYLNTSFGNDKPFKDYAYHFLPFVVILCFKIPFYFAPTQLKLYHTHNILFGKYFDYYPWFMLWHLSLYAVYLLFLIQHHAGVGSMRVWGRWLVGFFVAFIILSFTYYSLAHLELLSRRSDNFISLASCATIFFIAWYGQSFEEVADGKDLLDALLPGGLRSNYVSSQKMIIESVKGDPAIAKHDYSKLPEAEKYQQSGLPKSLALKLAEDLESLMHKEKLYIQNDLRLETLATKLNSNKHFVSQVINQNFKTNFFEYINLKRIEEAKQMLRTTNRKELNIIEVAYAVGFNNKGTFNAVFKRITGLTPTEFRMQSSQLLDTRNN